MPGHTDAVLFQQHDVDRVKGQHAPHVCQDGTQHVVEVERAVDHPRRLAQGLGQLALAALRGLQTAACGQVTPDDQCSHKLSLFDDRGRRDLNWHALAVAIDELGFINVLRGITLPALIRELLGGLNLVRWYEINRWTANHIVHGITGKFQSGFVDIGDNARLVDRRDDVARRLNQQTVPFFTFPQRRQRLLAGHAGALVRNPIGQVSSQFFQQSDLCLVKGIRPVRIDTQRAHDPVFDDKRE